MKKVNAFLISTLFGAGYFPFGSGTVGSFVALVILIGAAWIGGFWMVLGLTILAYKVGLKAIKKVSHYVDHDASIIVIDEFVGQAIAFMPLANLITNSNFDNFNFWMLCGISFLLFRFFDIIKPFPSSHYDSEVINEYGIMLDDVWAGIYAMLCLIGIMQFFNIT